LCVAILVVSIASIPFYAILQQLTLARFPPPSYSNGTDAPQMLTAFCSSFSLSCFTVVVVVIVVYHRRFPIHFLFYCCK
jgi:hypothetical protein